MNKSLCAVSLMRFVSGRVHGTSVPQMSERFYSSAESLFTLRSDVFLGRTWSAPEASETTAVERVWARRLKFPRPVNHRTSPGLVQSSLPLISATTPVDYSSSFITALICFLCKCDMLVFIWWRTLDSFHQIHRRPNASGVQIHENYLSFIYSHCLVLSTSLFSKIIAKMRQ